MRLSLSPYSEVQLWVDGVAKTLGGDRVELGDGSSTPVTQRALLRVRSDQHGGAAFLGPVEYTFGASALRNGDWCEQGLESYSGAMKLTQAFTLDPQPARAVLDLGRVRGMVAVRVNGTKVGERFMMPYRFDITSALRVGENRLELIVTNTLGPYLHTWSPTAMIYPDQLRSGIFGPVLLRMCNH